MINPPNMRAIAALVVLHVYLFAPTVVLICVISVHSTSFRIFIAVVCGIRPQPQRIRAMGYMLIQYLMYRHSAFVARRKFSPATGTA